MVGFLLRMLLGLALIALGFFLGAIYVVFEYYIPVCILLNNIVGSEQAGWIMDNCLNNENIPKEEGEAFARLFYIIYRLGYLLHKTEYFAFFIDACDNPACHKTFLDRIEAQAKRKGIVIPEKETKDE